MSSSSSSYARISHKKVRSRRYSSSNKKNKKTLRYAKAKGYHRNKKGKNGRRSVKHGGGVENINDVNNVDAKRRRLSMNYHELCNNSNKPIDWIHEAPNNGCKDNTLEPKKLGIGTRIDRFGPPTGSYFSPFKNDGTPYSYMSRSLPYINNIEFCVKEYNEVYDMPKHIYHVYKVLKEFTVNSCTASKAFGAPGGAIQYIAVVDETKTNNPTTMTINQLIAEGFIIELTDDEYTNENIKLPPFSLNNEYVIA